MATSKQVQSALKRFTSKIDRANDEIKDIIEVISDLEKVLETYNADEDVDINRSIKAEIRRGKKQVTELRKNLDKLDRELKDTNKKYHYLAS